MAEQRGNQNQNRGVTFMNECSSHTGFSTDDEAHSVVEQEKQAFLDLVRRQVDRLHQKGGGSSEYQQYARTNPNQPSGRNRWGPRPGFCDDSNNPSSTNLTTHAYDPYDDRDPWNIRPDGPSPNELRKSGTGFPNPCADNPDKSHAKNSVHFRENQNLPHNTKSTVNLGTLPWNPNPSSNRINYGVCNDRDRPGTRNRGKQELLHKELMKAQSYCKQQTANAICPPRHDPHSRPRTPEVSQSNLCAPRYRTRSLLKSSVIVLLAVCLILLILFAVYHSLCKLLGFHDDGRCKVEREIHYVPY